MKLKSTFNGITHHHEIWPKLSQTQSKFNIDQTSNEKLAQKVTSLVKINTLSKSQYKETFLT